MRRLVLLGLSLALLFSGSPASAGQDDAGSGGDAGDTFEGATELAPSGWFEGRLDRANGDTQDYYSFPLQEGRAFSVLVTFPASSTTDLVRLLDPEGRVIDTGTKFSGLGVASSTAFTAASVAFSPSSEISGVRLSVHRALQTGSYRLHLQADRYNTTSYALCVMNCDQVMSAPTELIFGGSLRHTDTQVLLVPPLHGDLGNPLGPNVLDYIQATIDGIRQWELSIDSFIDKYPQFSYLDEIEVSIEVFDEVNPVDPAGYDVVIGYVAAGPAFRGVATDLGDPFIEDILPGTHYSGRYIALSLFGSAPRAGQVAYDFPELVDLKNVTIHEFGHTFGLGHTRTWHPVLGADLMNSPASFVYGDGSPVGDGGERTDPDCLSSLNLYGMAELYSWIPGGYWYPETGWRDLPAYMPYEWFC